MRTRVLPFICGWLLLAASSGYASVMTFDGGVLNVPALGTPTYDEAGLRAAFYGAGNTTRITPSSPYGGNGLFRGDPGETIFHPLDGKPFNLSSVDFYGGGDSI